MPKNSLSRQNEACVLCEDVQSFAKNTCTNKITYGLSPCHITSVKNDYHSD